MQDPDQSIGQRSKRLVMGLASLTQGVVITARAGGAGQGAKGPLVAGIGEPPIATPASAMINAVYNAIGVWVEDIPLTRARVLAALKKS